MYNMKCLYVISIIHANFLDKIAKYAKKSILTPQLFLCGKEHRKRL